MHQSFEDYDMLGLIWFQDVLGMYDCEGHLNELVPLRLYIYSSKTESNF